MNETICVWLPYSRGDIMSHVAPAVRDKFETLPVELKNAILERDVVLNTIYDLMRVLEQIVAEGEENPS